MAELFLMQVLLLIGWPLSNCCVLCLLFFKEGELSLLAHQSRIHHLASRKQGYQYCSLELERTREFFLWRQGKGYFHSRNWKNLGANRQEVTSVNHLHHSKREPPTTEEAHHPSLSHLNENYQLHWRSKFLANAKLALKWKDALEWRLNLIF